MSNIHNVEDAYEQIAEALNYLEEHGEEPHKPIRKHSIVSGESGAVDWSPSNSKWVTLP